MIPPGISEHGYEPPADRLAALAQADLVLLVGMGLDSRFQSFLDSRPRPTRRVFEFARLVAADIAPEPGAAPHAHQAHDDHDHAAHDPHDDHDHDHAAGDPHLWLDPVLARVLLAKLAAELKTSPDAQQRALEQFDTLIADYRRRLDPALCPNRTIVVAHDAYGWLARRFDLRVVALAGLTAAEPTAESIAAAAAALREHHARAVFLEPQISPAAASRLAQQSGVPLLTLDPLGNGDYLTLMRRNLDALTRGMACARTRRRAGAHQPRPPLPETPSDIRVTIAHLRDHLRRRRLYLSRRRRARPRVHQPPRRRRRAPGHPRS